MAQSHTDKGISNLDLSQFRMTKDMHTHTVHSRGSFYVHGKGTVLENVEAAAARGLKAIAITDHGPGHKLYGLKQDDLPEIRQEIATAAARFPSVKVYLGVEANIVDVPDGLDVVRDDFALYDLVLAGYHYGTANGHMVGNWLSANKMMPMGSSGRMRNSNTEMTLRALYNNDIYALTHPGDKGQFDMRELCRACEETNTLMEISARHRQLTVQDIKIAMDYDLKFIISSDAHKPSQVGTYVPGISRAIEAGLDLARIVNIEEIAR